MVWSVRLRVRYGDCNSKFSMKKKKKKIADGSDGEESHVGGFHALVRISLLVLL